MLENNPADADLCIRMLHHAGLKAEVDVTGSVQEFVQWAGTRDYDVVLSDFGTPDGNGLDALHSLRSLGVHIPFILVTGSIDDEQAIEWIRQGASDYLLKDNLRRLPVAVRRALDEHRTRQARDRAEDALRESDGQYRRLFNANPEPLWVYKRETLRFLAVNDAAIRHYGYTLAEFLSMSAQDLRPRQDMERSPAVIGPDLKSGCTRELCKHQKKDGSIIDVEISSQSIIFHAVEAVLLLANDVTEKRRSEERLVDSEARLKEAQRTLHIGSWQSLPDGRVNWSDEMFELHKLPSDVPLTYEATLSMVHPQDRDRSRETLWKGLESDAQDFQNEYRVVWPDGQIRHMFSQAQIHRDHAGRVSEVIGTVQDVTERKQTEGRLQEYARVVEALEEMILVVDRDYHYLIANREFLNFRGMSREHVLGHSVEEVVGKDVFEESVKEKMDECFLGKVVQYEMSYNFPRLGKRNLAVSYYPIEGPTGVDRIACVLQDITDRKLSEDAFHKSEERFSKAFCNSPLATTISTQAEGRYLDVNDAFLNLLGYKRQDVIGHTAEELRFWAEPLERMDWLRQVKENKQVAKYTTKYRTTKGEIREVEVWMESIDLDGQPCLLVINRDITEIQQLEAQFRQAQKMEAVGRLAGGVAHDFNNLLGIIIGYSDLSLELVGRESPEHRYLSETKKAAHRAASLTRQLLTFSRRQVVFPKILDLNEVIRNATNMFLRLVGEDIAVEFRPTTPLGSIKADPGHIEQVLMNLVVNARDAMPTGGKIVIETAQGELDDECVPRHAGPRPGDYVSLVVSDTGCGMNENLQSQIFEPFFTTKSPGLGTGLGLSTVYGIVKQSEGYILVYSEPGKGTTFKIYFPRLGAKPETLLWPHEAAEPPRGSETILLVEDDEPLREVAGKLLRNGGYRVIEAKDPQDALSIVAAGEPKIDLLLTDVIMPGKGGADLVREAREVHPEIRSLFMSGYAGDLIGQQGVLMPESSFLGKPFTRRSLLTKVYSALHIEYPKQQ
jgi:two-component system, cell cycle sensor histidine kinase and response regulator CckA